MEFITIVEKDGLIAHVAAIEALFLESFGSPLSPDLWKWAYLDNPNGQPVVSLCYDEGRLVGHYAAIAMPLTGQGVTLNSYLSVTTMVAASHRAQGVFVTLGEATYQAAADLGVDFVMGFPNAAATPGRRKRLHWTLPQPDYVAAATKAQLLAAAAPLQALFTDSWALDLRHVPTREWRMSRPGAAYVWEDGLVYKRFEGAIDLMYFDSVDALQRLPDGATINLLLPHSFTDLQEHRLFDYQFGGKAIGRDFQPERILRQMCLSDVF